MRYFPCILFAWSVFFTFSAHADNHTANDSELAIQRTCSLEAIWKDKGSGADLDGFFYLPYIEPSAFIIGGYGTKTKKLASLDCVLTVNEEKHLVAPINWELIWKDKGSGAKKDGSMWRAIPPGDEYVCIGTIPQKGYEMPDLPNYRCVHASFTEKVITSSLIWSDKGSGAKKKVTMFKLPNSGSFVAVEGRLAQLETYDLKVDSTLLGRADEAEILAEADTQDNSEEKGSKNSFGSFLKDNKKLLGAVGGAVVTAVIANKFDASVLEIIIASGLGAIVGGELANLISSETENKAIASTIETQHDGETTTIKREDGTADLQVTTDNSRTENRKVTVVRKKNIASPPKLELIGEKYRAKVSSNVRQSPSTDSEIVDGLTEGENFNAVGKVIDKNWYLVGKDNIAIGYVYGNLVELKTEDEIEQEVVLRDAVDLDSLGESDDAGVVDLDELTVADEIEVNTSCKEMKVSDGRTSTESTICKGSDGAWEIS